MNHATNCQFCKKPMTLEIDDEYAAVGDPFKLLRFASCNFCADIRVERRALESQIKRLCKVLAVLPVGDTKKRDSIQNYLDTLTKKYAEMIARWHHMDGSLWEQEILTLLTQNPQKWASILGKLWQMFRQWRKEHEERLV